MKLILQIALGVYLGAVAAQFTIDTWHARQQEAARALAAKEAAERNARIEAIFKHARGAQGTDSGRPPPGFVPDDDADAAVPKPEP